jgi:hypothetical protein
MQGRVKPGAMSRIRSSGAGTLSILAALSCVVVAVAGCGATDAASGTVTDAQGPSTKSPQQVLQFSQCMRAHGVSDFPDPTDGGIRITPSIAQSPNFQTAQNDCKRYLPNGGQPPVTAPGDRAAALAFAKCMRTHGEPDFPDPLTSTPSSPPAGARAVLDLHGMVFELGSGINPQSLAFQQAAKDCGVGTPNGNKAAP